MCDGAASCSRHRQDQLPPAARGPETQTRADPHKVPGVQSFLCFICSHVCPPIHRFAPLNGQSERRLWPLDRIGRRQPGASASLLLGPLGRFSHILHTAAERLILRGDGRDWTRCWSVFWFFQHLQLIGCNQNLLWYPELPSFCRVSDHCHM